MQSCAPQTSMNSAVAAMQRDARTCSRRLRGGHRSSSASHRDVHIGAVTAAPPMNEKMIIRIIAAGSGHDSGLIIT